MGLKLMNILIKYMSKNFTNMFLLDRNPPEVLMCAQCKLDYRIDVDKLHKAGWNTSDGTCVNHFIKMLKTSGMNDDMIKASVQKVLQKYPNKPHPLDLNDQNNKSFLDWLRNPTPSPKSS